MGCSCGGGKRAGLEEVGDNQGWEVFGVGCLRLVAPPTLLGGWALILA